MIPIIFYILSLNFIPNTVPTKTYVYIHLEQFYTKYNLLHIGISFKNSNKNLRYDFRAFNDGNSCLTTPEDRRNLEKMFPDLYNMDEYYDKEYIKYRDIIDNIDNDNYDNLLSKNIFWGITNKTLDEIIDYEKTINTKYRLGIYDCRHYVNKFTSWCMDKPTPIWSLYKLWNKYNF